MLLVMPPEDFAIKFVMEHGLANLYVMILAYFFTPVGYETLISSSEVSREETKEGTELSSVRRRRVVKDDSI